MEVSIVNFHNRPRFQVNLPDLSIFLLACMLIAAPAVSRAQYDVIAVFSDSSTLIST